MGLAARPRRHSRLCQRQGARELLAGRLTALFSTLQLMRVGACCDGKPLRELLKATVGITPGIVKSTRPHTFQVIRRRWVVERTFGWLMRYRRLARDYERRPGHHEAMVYWAAVFIMTRRLTRYENRQPPVRGWGGDRKPPGQQAPAAA